MWLLVQVRVAQFLGASAVVIADNQCVCDDVTCTSEHPGETCQSSFPEITGDGSENDISIPSFLLNRHDASVLIEELRGNHPMQMQLSWGWKSKDRVEYSIFSGPHDSYGKELVKNLKHVAVALGSDAFFTPHMNVHSGERYGCTKHRVEDGMESCANMCTNSGRYCALDHHVLESDGKTYTNITGATTLEESLRRLCIWQHYGETDGVGAQWWNYIEEFNSRCGNRPEYFGNADCIRDTFNHVQIDSVMIDECMRDSGGVSDGLNTLLEAELNAKEAHGIVREPSVLINGVPMKGPLNTWTIFYALCDAFAYDAHYPEVCERCRWHDGLEACLGNGGDIADTPKPRKKHRAMAFWITFFVLGILGGVGYYVYQKSRDEESNMIADYVPFLSPSSGVK